MIRLLVPIASEWVSLSWHSCSDGVRICSSSLTSSRVSQDEVALDESCCDSGGSIDRGLMHAFNKLERKGSISLQTVDGVFMVESI